MLDKVRRFTDKKFKRVADADQIDDAIMRAQEIEFEINRASCGMNMRDMMGVRTSSRALDLFACPDNLNVFNARFVQLCQKATRLEIVTRDVADGQTIMTVTLLGKHARFLMGLNCYLSGFDDIRSELMST